MLLLSLVFVVVLLWPAIRSPTPAVSTALDVASVAIWAAFLVEYGIGLWLSSDRWGFVRTHVPDLIVIAVPFLRPLRALRLLRLLGLAGVVGKIAQANVRMRTTVYVATVTAGVLVGSSLVVLDAERDAEGGSIRTFGDALWWALTTVTTVGYGDRYPVTLMGRLAAAALMLTGIALLGVTTASVASWFVERIGSAREAVEQVVESENQQVLAALARIENRLAALESERRRSPDECR